MADLPAAIITHIGAYLATFMMYSANIFQQHISQIIGTKERNNDQEEEIFKMWNTKFKTLLSYLLTVFMIEEAN
jgi:hypothetical protein